MRLVGAHLTQSGTTVLSTKQRYEIKLALTQCEHDRCRGNAGHFSSLDTHTQISRRLGLHSQAACRQSRLASLDAIRLELDKALRGERYS